MEILKDIEGKELQIGDLVWYAVSIYEKPRFAKATISKITKSGGVKMINADKKYASQESFLSSRPEQQILLIESRTRKTLTEKIKDEND